MLISVCPGLRSQDMFVDAAGERIEACSDRTMYVSGEHVLFSAVIFKVKDSPAVEFSRVFYCELITPEGRQIAGGKYLLQNFAGQGSLQIPEETISGIYFLKFYTRFMRNISTGDYKYIMLKIINPFKTEVLRGKEVFDTTHAADNSIGVVAGDISPGILPGKKTFSPREEILLNISIKPGKEMPARLCLSVTPGATFEDRSFPDKNKQKTDENVVYLPETRGVSLSGKLIGKQSGKPVPDANVNLSIIGDKDILVVRTDSNGRFFFALPGYYGNRDIFMCAGEVPDVVPEIFIDNDFCSRQVNLPSLVFTLDEEEKQAAFKLVVNSRVSSVYREKPVSVDSTAEEIKTSFYGKPSSVLVVDKYIELPSLGEYFTELPGIVKLRKVKGKKQFTFIDSQLDIYDYKPLMLVDWVAVEDIDKILAMSPLEIERIELVNSPYVKGNITYGGIISFVSKKSNFAGIDLPTSGTFVNYRFLQDSTLNTPPVRLSASIPDSRNTVYWNPAVQTTGNGNARITFTAPDTPGKYSILVREMRKNGEVVLTKEMIEVKAD
jgi:hypothetical protein